jgi:hypothetical protein
MKPIIWKLLFLLLLVFIYWDLEGFGTIGTFKVEFHNDSFYTTFTVIQFQNSISQ